MTTKLNWYRVRVPQHFDLAMLYDISAPGTSTIVEKAVEKGDLKITIPAQLGPTTIPKGRKGSLFVGFLKKTAIGNFTVSNKVILKKYEYRQPEFIYR